VKRVLGVGMHGDVCINSMLFCKIRIQTAPVGNGGHFVIF